MEAPLPFGLICEQTLKYARAGDSGDCLYWGKPVLPRRLLTKAVDNIVGNPEITGWKPRGTRDREKWRKNSLYAAVICI